jgi:hypothetical protein
MAIGLNHRTAPVAVRERFWISESRRLDALHELIKAEGIEEVIVLATCNRTGFLLWRRRRRLGKTSPGLPFIFLCRRIVVHSAASKGKPLGVA